MSDFEGLGFQVQGSEFRVQGLGLWALQDLVKHNTDDSRIIGNIYIYVYTYI